MRLRSPFASAPADVLVVGLGNPGDRYQQTRHNAGALAAEQLIARWELSGPRKKFRGRLFEGRLRPGGPRIALLLPQTFMNESGAAVGPARGALKVEPDRLVVLHDEIDLPFGEIQPRLGGGLAGHNGLKSLRASLGTPDFWRVRIGVGRPDTTDPEVVSRHVLGRFAESPEDVAALLGAAADAAERLVAQVSEGERSAAG